MVVDVVVLSNRPLQVSLPVHRSSLMRIGRSLVLRLTRVSGINWPIKGETLNIRPIAESDAEEFLPLRKRLADETPFLLRSSDEITLTIEQQRGQIRQFQQGAHLLLVAQHSTNSLVGFLMGVRGEPHRTRHVLTLVIGVLQAHTRQGIGTRLFAEMEQWSECYEIHR